MEFVATIPPSSKETLIIRRGSNMYHAVPIPDGASIKKESIVSLKEKSVDNFAQKSRPFIRRIRRKVENKNPISTASALKLNKPLATSHKNTRPVSQINKPDPIRNSNRSSISTNNSNKIQASPRTSNKGQASNSNSNSNSNANSNSTRRPIARRKNNMEPKMFSMIDLISSHNMQKQEDVPEETQGGEQGGERHNEEETIPITSTNNSSGNEEFTPPSLSSENQSDVGGPNDSKKKGQNSLGDFMEFYSVKGNNNNVQGKSSHIYCNGDSMLIAKQTKHIYGNGYHHYVKNGMELVSLEGSHAYGVNCGEHVVGVPFETNGVKRWGTAQETTLFLVGTVDNRGISHLKNPSAKDNASMIFLPNPDANVLVSLDYIISSVDKNYTMAGKAMNTVRVLADGCTKWFNNNFQQSDNFSNFPSPITLFGVDLFRFNNAISIEIKNGENNGEIRLLVKATLIFLQM